MSEELFSINENAMNAGENNLTVREVIQIMKDRDPERVLNEALLKVDKKVDAKLTLSQSGYFHYIDLEYRGKHANIPMGLLFDVDAAVSSINKTICSIDYSIKKDEVLQKVREKVAELVKEYGLFEKDEKGKNHLKKKFKRLLLEEFYIVPEKLKIGFYDVEISMFTFVHCPVVSITADKCFKEIYKFFSEEDEDMNVTVERSLEAIIMYRDYQITWENDKFKILCKSNAPD